MNSGVYRKAMKEAARLNIPVMAHCEDINLVMKMVFINLSDKSIELGVKGINLVNAVEDVIAMRDIMLAKETICNRGNIHLCHCSTKDNVEMVKRAKEEGIKPQQKFVHIIFQCVQMI